MSELLRSDAPTATWYRPDWPDWPGLVAGFTSRQWRPSIDAAWRDDWTFRRPPDDSAPPGLAHLRTVLDLPEMAIVGEQQVHGDTITTVWHKDILEPEFHLVPASDGLILPQSGVLGIAQAADCCIGLLVEPERQFAALFHAGWRGAVGGLPIKMVKQLESEHGIAPESLWIATCPAIQQACFQIGPEVARRFAEWEVQLPYPDPLVLADPSTPNRWLADLPRLIMRQLLAAGIPAEQLRVSNLDTYSSPEFFFSYRRDGAGMGLQIGFCGWRPLR